jgi:hypothetical protein
VGPFAQATAQGLPSGRLGVAGVIM